MKIVIYLHCLTFGGTERMAVHIANHFSDVGCEVTVLCNMDPGYVSYPLRKEVSTVVMDVGGKRGSSVFKSLKDKYRRIMAVRREVKRLNPDYLISMTPTSNIAAAIGCFGLKLVKVGREQNYPAAEPPGKKKRTKYRGLTYRWLDTVVAQTDKTKLWLKENTSAKKIAVIPGAVVLPLERSSPVVIPQLQGDFKLLLAVGRLTAAKQFDHLIRAFKHTSERLPGWQLVILGEGNTRESLEELVDELELGSTVLMPGFVGNAGDWYKEADLFALTSAYEGFPNAVIEALAHGVPVVSYDCDTGPKEMIENNINGLLVTPNSVEDLQDSLMQLMGNDEKRRAAGESAINIIDRLNINTICEQWLDVFYEARDRVKV